MTTYRRASGRDPEAFLASMLDQAEILHTSCDHGQMRWQRWSQEGPALVLLHGGFGSWNHWVRNIPELADHFTLYTLDLPGLGESADLPEPQTPEHFGKVVLAGLDQIIGSAAHFQLAGFSFGAMIGAHVAALGGSRCERFIAVGAAGFGDLHVQVSLQRPPAVDTPWAEAHSIHHGNLRALMFSSDDHIDELAVHCHHINLARHRFNSRRLSLTTDFVETLPRIAAPLMGVWGSRDATAGGRGDIEKRRQLFKSVQADSQFHILDGVGHWAMYESPDRINALLLNS